VHADAAELPGFAGCCDGRERVGPRPCPSPARSGAVVACGPRTVPSAPPTAVRAAAAAPAVKISYVKYDSPGSDTGSNYSLNGEYVVIKNTTGTARSLTGWTLRDKTGYTYKFPRSR